MELPMWFGFIAAPLMAGFAGLLIGWFCVRLTSLYFGMLQISLGSLLWAIVFRWYALTNGDDGIHGVPLPSFLSSVSKAYYFILFFFVLCLTTNNGVRNNCFVSIYNFLVNKLHRHISCWFNAVSCIAFSIHNFNTRFQDKSTRIL
jgi:branched-chain amino acid transport system permease protein